MDLNRVSVGLVSLSILATVILFYFSLATTPIELPKSAQKGVEDQNSRSIREISQPSFRDATLEYGLTLGHREGDERVTGLDDVVGPGVCVLDYDGDGWMDLFVVNGSGDARYYGKPHWWQDVIGHRLFRNIGGRKFADVTQKAGFSRVATSGMGCASADFDNDGDPDLIVTSRNSIALFRNDAGKTFVDVTPKLGLPSSGWFTAIAVADVDGDGNLDLYLGRYVQFIEGAHTYESNSQNKADNPASFNPSLYRAQSNYMLKGHGNLEFTDVTSIAGVANEDGRTYAAVLADINRDQKPDLVVTNHAGTGSTKVYANTGGFKFSELGISSQLQSGLGFRGIGFGDIDNNGTQELVLAGETGATASLLVMRSSTQPDAFSPVFSDEARQRGVAQDRFSSYSQWSPLLADLNNDGFLDLFLANGSLLPDPDSGRVPLGQPKLLLLNKGDGTFDTLPTERNNPLNDAQSARGAAIADFNNDGALDVFVAHNNDLGQLLINQTSQKAHWIGMKLSSGKGNYDAIGSVVEIETPATTQTKIVTKTQGFLSDGDSRIHFGLGSEAKILRLAIKWSDGSRMVYRDVPTDAYISINQQRGIQPLATSNAAQVVRPRLKLKLGSENPERRAGYLDILLSVYEPAQVVGEMTAASVDRSPLVRRHVAQLFGVHRTPEGLRALTPMLEDSNSEVVAAAIDGLCLYEEESSVRWLLRMIDHPAPSVRRALANCFSFFYREEEAVIHRKYLALPYLMRLLSDGDKSVVIAAAEALANSERFRAIEPLLNLIGSKDDAVSTSALRAIGLVRERSAIPSLVKLVSNRNYTPPRYAHALIGLKRLDYDKLEWLLGDFMCGRKSFEGVKLSDRISTMRLLTQYEDGLVFAITWLLEVAPCLTEAHTLDSLSEAAGLEMVEILSAASSQVARNALSLLVASKHPSVRVSAALELNPINSISASTGIFQLLRDRDLTVRRLILQKLRERHTEIPISFALDLLDQPDIVFDTVKSISAVREKSIADKLFGLLSNAASSDVLRINVLNLLSTVKPFSYVMPVSIRDSNNEGVRVAAMQYEASRLPSLFVSRKLPEFISVYLADPSVSVRAATAEFLLKREEYWAKNTIIEILRSPSTEDFPMRVRLVQGWPPSYLDVSSVVIEIAQNHEHPLHIYAVEKLLSTGNREFDDVLFSVLLNKSADQGLRFRIAKELSAARGQAVLAILRGGT